MSWTPDEVFWYMSNHNVLLICIFFLFKAVVLTLGFTLEPTSPYFRTIKPESLDVEPRHQHVFKASQGIPVSYGGELLW